MDSEQGEQLIQAVQQVHADNLAAQQQNAQWFGLFSFEATCLAFFVVIAALVQRRARR